MPCRRSKTKSAMSNASTTESRKRKSQDNVQITVDKRRRQFQIQNQFISIAGGDSLVATSKLVPSHDELQTAGTSTRSTPSELFVGSQFRFQNYFITPTRHSPLPKLNWADSKEVWRVMMEKEIHYAKEPAFLERHPLLQPKMRTILLDWLIEVCEVYKLHRETYYLALDFLDRYLTKEKNIIKGELQLIGITALFIAAKLEEIYPPKLADFAYVTDGACLENDILDEELIMLTVLKWHLTPITVCAWLNVYLQIASLDKISEDSFELPQYSSHAFVQIARLIDLCMLDISSLDFSNSVLAASALYHKSSSSNVVHTVSGLTMADMLDCIRWMEPYAQAIKEAGPVELKFFPTVHIDDSHNIQTHAVDIELLGKAHEKRELEAARCHDLPAGAEVNLLTPPLSDKKGNPCDNFMCSSSTPESSKHSEEEEEEVTTSSASSSP